MSSLLSKRKLPGGNIALSDSEDDASTENDNFNDNSSVDSAKGKDDKKETDKKKKEDEVLLQTTKRPRFAKPFTEDLLTSWDGMRRIYEEFPNKCKFNARGSEAAYLSRLLGLYKEWAFQLHPGLAFNDVLRKAEALGPKGRVRLELTRLRESERDRYIDEHFPSVKEEKVRRQKLELENEERERVRAEREKERQQRIPIPVEIVQQRSPPVVSTVDEFNVEDLPDDLIALLDGPPAKSSDEPVIATIHGTAEKAEEQEIANEIFQDDDEDEEF